jgi:hypothetical protein
VWTERETRESVTVAGHRRDDPEHVERVTWTLDRARAAGYANRGGKYDTDPQTMLYARAAGDVCRRIAADVLAGFPELDDGDPAPAVPVTPSGVVQRRPREVVGSVDPVAPVPPAAPTTAPDSPPDQPPAPASVGDPAPVDDPEPEPPAPVLEVPPAPEGEPVADPLPTPPDGITTAQLPRVQALLNALHVRGPEARHTWLSQSLGRDITSTKQLTKAEASQTIDHIEWELAHRDDRQ